ncbi:hypothetical protein GCM10010124_14030 [Pilimelia terevasa]|uniref:N-acetyltransferase domain-containing protein n=1 Tax=Pilimelia terevasa TaxID=53372 RepID=A0A8J3BMV3_9ACTN|nr:GNAT family N-acetyltransferase [Pilimelia terevasa]GGK22695.1 hypothetical protein GCM10010124_14030 [Pilimelia terevasa]
MEYPSEFDAPGVRLRAYRDEDTAGVLAIGRDPETIRYTPGASGDRDAEAVRTWIRVHSRSRWAEGRYDYAAADPQTDEFLGSGYLRVTARWASGEIGYLVRPTARRRGVATAMTRALADLGFARGLRRIELRTMWENVNSQRVALAAGFRREAELRAALPGDSGHSHDVIVWSRLAADDGARVPPLLPPLPAGALSDGVVTLRGVGPGDAAAVRALVGPDGGWGAPPGHDLVTWCARSPARWLAGERADLLVLDAPTGAPVGLLALDRWEPAAGHAVLCAAAVPQERRQGDGARAVALLAAWAFSAGAARLAAVAAADDIAWQRVLSGAGFQPQGRLAAFLPRPGGAWADAFSYALLPSYQSAAG